MIRYSISASKWERVYILHFVLTIKRGQIHNIIFSFSSCKMKGHFDFVRFALCCVGDAALLYYFPLFGSYTKHTCAEAGNILAQSSPMCNEKQVISCFSNCLYLNLSLPFIISFHFNTRSSGDEEEDRDERRRSYRERRSMRVTKTSTTININT